MVLIIFCMFHWLNAIYGPASRRGDWKMWSSCVLRWKRSSLVSIHVVVSTRSNLLTLGKSGVAPLEVSMRVERIGQVETSGAGCRVAGQQVCEKSILSKGDSLGVSSDRTGFKY